MIWEEKGMKLYFSGLGGAEEAAALREAGIQAVLADPRDLPRALAFPRVVLDSGAYRAWKKGGAVDPDAYLELVKSLGGRIEFAVAPDVIGDPEATYRNWLRVRRHPKVVPVWQWGAPRERLEEHLAERELVCVGGLVPLMRARDEKMLAELEALCREFPGRLHVLGINWLKAIERLRGLAASGDTSKWLDGGRYGHVIFVHARTGHLHQAPARVLGLGRLGRRERNVLCAKNLAEFCAAGGCHGWKVA